MQTNDKIARQQDVTRLCIQCAVLLMQHGAETTLVEQLSTRLGRALGMDAVDSSISANAIVLSTLSQDHCLTMTRKNLAGGINMQMVTELQHLIILTEHKLLDEKDFKKRLEQIKPLYYPKPLLIFMVGLACSCFCWLAAGSFGSIIITFCISCIAMFTRITVAQMKINPIINFCITAFIATSLCGLTTRYILVDTPSVAMASCILLLVPGFPLINAIADMFKGHVNTGVARWTVATLLTLSTCIGVVMAIGLWDLQGW